MKELRVDSIKAWAIAILLASGAHGLALAATEKIAFNMPQQSMSQALLEFSEKTKLTVMFNDAQLGGQIAQSLVGNYSPEEALGQLLDGSPLTYVFTDSNTLVVKAGTEIQEVTTPDEKEKSDSQSIQKENNSTLEEIVVTATKRSTSLQDTAMSVTAIGGDILDKMGVMEIGQIIDTVPGVTYISLGGSDERITIRGLATSSLGQYNKPTIATSLNDFPMDIGLVDVGLVDLNRVEVIKGPQGTLYGQSAMGGVVRYMTNEPNTDKFEGGVRASTSSIASGGMNYGGSAYFNIPISENFSARAVVYSDFQSGITDNTATGEDDINDTRTTGGRLALKWDITNRATLDALILTNSNKHGGNIGSGGNSAFGTFTRSTSGPLNIQPPNIDDPSMTNNDPGFSKLDYSVYNLRFNYDFDNFSLSLMGAKKYRKSHLEYDAGAWIGIYDSDTNAWYDESREYESSTFEARMVSTGEGPFEWIAGFWYEDVTGDIAGQFPVYTSTGINIYGYDFTDGELFYSFQEFDDDREVAGYGEIGYRPFDSLKVSVGYRRSHVALDQGVVSATGVFSGGFNARIGADEKVTENVNTYRFNVEYTVNDDFLAYGTVSSGYRAGGVNPGGLFGLKTTYGSDTLWNYEIGLRTSWLDQRLTANLFVYYLDWTDLQLSQWDNDVLGYTVQNVGAAEVNGMEAELHYVVSDSLSVNLNYGYTDATFGEDYILENTGEVRAEAGSKLPGSSKYTASFIADYQRPLTQMMDLIGTFNFRYISGRRAELASGYPDMPGYELLNLSLGVHLSSGIEVTAFADNVFDKRTVVAHWFYGAGSAEQVLAEMINTPRVVGLRMSYDF